MIGRKTFWVWRGRGLRIALVGVASLATGGCRLNRHAPWETVPLPQSGIEIVRLKSGSKLDLDRVRFYSRELGEARYFLVLKPSGVQSPRDVWVLNHGWTDRPEDLLSELGVDEVYERLLTAGRARPALVVLPDVRFSGYYRRNSERFPFAQYLVLVAEEVAGLVAETYHVPLERERWSIGGFSFGGYISLDIARRYMGRFGSASVISAFFDPEWTFWPTDLPPAGRIDARGRGKQTTVVPGPTPRLMLACGASDRFIVQMRALHDRLTALGVNHLWSEARGGHTWKYWRSVLDPMFTFHLPPEPGTSIGRDSAAPGPGAAVGVRQP